MVNTKNPAKKTVKKKTGLLGIMVADAKVQKAVLARYARYNTTKMRLFSFTPSDIDWERKKITGLHRIDRNWKKGLFPFPDIIYNRCYEVNEDLIDRLEAVMGKNKCFNHINHLNKYEMYGHLSQSLDAFLPETIPYDKKTAADFLTAHKLLYLKPCLGNKGQGVYRVEMKESGQIHIGEHHIQSLFIAQDLSQFLEKMDEYLGSTPYIIQQGVNVRTLVDRVFDIRVLVQKNRAGLWSVTSAVSRVSYSGCFNTSLFEHMYATQDFLQYLYTPEKAQALMLSIHDVSLKAAECIETYGSLHLGELSVDLALDCDDRPWIIEVNGKPQKNLYKHFESYGTAYKLPLEYAHFLRNRPS
ncbi:hypothetical protein PM3016_2279 [Paenibacillus mucilaginosus 3016]|uniref:ATP-grasp domain-containing protein n=1 Tax=Paenibacillus mucilaginosus 3016 TaxID=1116391 RepID=H6NJ88_9BACL|nr:YheC/YheD family protein [Paenibacillus mucilaginosus]AFC29167.1 hypothetical protein PM3016_2279 [Paenibacillus mucilaginosus 3016]WFA17901.1 YheC/YheD family protein [Paenibacillus mucilaginosus]